MKKLLIVGLMVVMLMGCSKSDPYGLGEYKGRTYINESFDLDFEILEQYSFLTREELDVKNKTAQEAPNAVEGMEYFNNVLNISSLSGVKMIAYVDSTPNLSTTEDREANQYLDHLSSNGIAYSLDKGTQMINGSEYFKLSLKLDFGGLQDTYLLIKNGKLLNLQITYTEETQAEAQELLEMIGANE